MKIGYTSGIFDMFHIGHLNMLKRAKADCDYLIVGVYTDEIVLNLNHKLPIIPYNDRKEIVQAIKYVDEVYEENNKDESVAFNKLHFDILYMEDDRCSDIRAKEMKFLESRGVDFVFLPYSKAISAHVFCNEPKYMRERREQDLVVGYTTGVYDMFHKGHLNILKKAKEACDYLIVGVSTDELVLKEKNKIPIIPFKERIEIVKSIKYVDQVVPQINKNKLNAWEKIRFNKMFVGSDWQGSNAWNEYEKQFRDKNVSIHYINHTDGISSTMLRERINGNREEFEK